MSTETTLIERLIEECVIRIIMQVDGIRGIPQQQVSG